MSEATGDGESKSIATAPLENPANRASQAEGDIVLSAEQQAAIKRLEVRKALIKPLIDGVVPDRPLEYFIRAVAIKYGKGVAEMDDEDRGEAQVTFRWARSYKQRLIDKIGQMKVDDSDLETYILALHSTVRILSPANTEVDIPTIVVFANAAESTEQALLHQQLAKQWKDKFLVGIDDKTLEKRAAAFRELITKIAGSNIISPGRPEPRPSNQTIQLFQAFTELYDYIYSLPENQQNGEIVREFTQAAQRVGLERSDPEQTRKIMRLFQEVASYPDQEVLKIFTNIIINYSSNHGLTEEAISGFVDKLLPAIQNKDPQIEILLRGGNIWGMRKGNFGVGDFLTHAYAVKVNSSNVGELLLAAREVPTTTLSRLEQNRLDALTMATPFGILRDFIHDQRPYVHEVLEAMVRYYDTGDRHKLEVLLPRADYFNSKDRRDMIFDRTLYEMEVEERTKGWPNEQGGKSKSIDVLRRLVENTKPVLDLPPTTSDDELNVKLQRLAESKSGQVIPRETLASTVDYINAKLIGMMTKREIGLEPNYILALSWLERRGFEVLQGLRYEDQLSAYREKWFISLLKFQELTSSPSDSDEVEFHIFIEQLKSAPSSIEAYRMISKRTLNHINALAGKYKELGRTDTGALWSGNMAHEFIGLVDFRPAATKQGRQARNENVRRLTEPGYHPGG